MVSKEDFVSFEQAKVLKELGFDWECNHYYHLYDEMDTLSVLPKFENFNKFDKNWSAPTLYQAQKWLYEKFRIWISVDPYDNNTGFCFTLYKEHDIEFYYYGDDKGYCSTHVSALRNGITKVLEYLKTQDENNGK